jgi:hypothetical protein
MKIPKKVVPTSKGHKQVEVCDPPHCGCAVAPPNAGRMRYKGLSLPAGAHRVSINHVITRADGTVDVIDNAAVRFRNPFKNLWWQLFKAPAVERNIVLANHRAKALRSQ